MAKNKTERRRRTKRVIRNRIAGTEARPRLTVFRSNTHIYAQLVDDQAGRTIASANSLQDGISGDNPVSVGKEVGKRLAEVAKEAGVESAIFDRNGYRYHGRVKALAEGAREGGLKF